MSEPVETDTAEQQLEAELLERREAALAQVVKFGDPVLKSKASPVSEFGPELRAEVERMASIMRDGMGVGLAATQLGILRRLLVFQAGPDSEPTALVNPEVEWLSEEAVLAEEGCLSLPRVSMDVERPLHIRVSGRDADGEPVSIEASTADVPVSTTPSVATFSPGLTTKRSPTASWPTGLRTSLSPRRTATSLAPMSSNARSAAPDCRLARASK